MITFNKQIKVACAVAFATFGLISSPVMASGGACDSCIDKILATDLSDPGCKIVTSTGGYGSELVYTSTCTTPLQLKNNWERNCKAYGYSCIVVHSFGPVVNLVSPKTSSTQSYCEEFPTYTEGFLLFKGYCGTY